MKFVIWSIEHDAWWRPGPMGYTRVLAEAGRYEMEDAKDIVTQVNVVRVNACLVPVECRAPIARGHR